MHVHMGHFPYLYIQKTLLVAVTLLQLAADIYIMYTILTMCTYLYYYIMLHPHYNLSYFLTVLNS